MLFLFLEVSLLRFVSKDSYLAVAAVNDLFAVISFLSKKVFE